MPEPSPAPAVEASGPSREQALAVGRKLNLARMVRAVNPATSARDLLVPWDDLEAIEGGDFGRVAGKVRLAVLIRAYGNYLGLDGNELAGPWRAEIDRLAPPPEPGRGLAKKARRGAAVASAALLLAGGVGYGTVHRLGPVTPVPARLASPAADGRPAVLPAALTGLAASEGTKITPPAAPPRPEAAEAPAEEAPAAKVRSRPEPATPVPDGSPTAPEGGGVIPAVASVPRPLGLPPAAADDRGGDPPGAGGADPAPVPEPSPAPAAATGEPAIDGPRAGLVPAAIVGPPLAAADDGAEGRTFGDARPGPAPPAPPAGGWAVQVAAVRGLAEVAAEWRRSTARHPSLAGLAPRDPQVIEVPGRGRFWRVLAGAFATRAEAEDACDRLRAEGGACRVTEVTAGAAVGPVPGDGLRPPAPAAGQADPCAPYARDPVQRLRCAMVTGPERDKSSRPPAGTLTCARAWTASPTATTRRATRPASRGARRQPRRRRDDRSAPDANRPGPTQGRSRSVKECPSTSFWCEMSDLAEV